MPKFFNLDALIPDTVTVNIAMPDGTTKTFTLKDDFPDEIGFGIIRLIQHISELRQGASVNSAESIIGQLQLVQGDGTHLLGEIFRHTDETVTDADLSAWLKPVDRLGLLTAFFTSLMTKFRGQPSSSAETTTETAPMEQEPSIPPDETPSPNDSTPEQTEPTQQTASPS